MSQIPYVKLADGRRQNSVRPSYTCVYTFRVYKYSCVCVLEALVPLRLERATPSLTGLHVSVASIPIVFALRLATPMLGGLLSVYLSAFEGCIYFLFLSVYPNRRNLAAFKENRC